jgi:DNA mismatch repair protein PMS2
LNAIEVQDNGSGISSENYETLALKHYTSKLSKHEDLMTLETFGFRGEALSSLCALSRVSAITCLASDAPKGSRLEFETSGKLRGTSIVAAQKGTTVMVEELFHNLPVRRRELERNIKREWNRVIGVLNQYACIQIGIKFTVSQQPTKGKKIVLFSTKGNKTTQENIVNVFGAKTLSVLIALELELELEPTHGPSQRWSTQDDEGTKRIRIRGHVSRPAHGEGRQTPDRQMFFVNGRPCGLPQFAKTFNEVYKSFNSSQSPFIFADIQLDTHMYDVNVSPDKRTILLHDQSRMLDNLRDSLVELFEAQHYSVPVSQLGGAKHTPFKKLALSRKSTVNNESGKTDDSSAGDDDHAEEGPLTKRTAKIAPETDRRDDDEGETYESRVAQGRSPSSSTAHDGHGLSLVSRWAERESNDRRELTPSAISLATGKQQGLIPRPQRLPISMYARDSEERLDHGDASDEDQHEPLEASNSTVNLGDGLAELSGLTETSEAEALVFTVLDGVLFASAYRLFQVPGYTTPNCTGPYPNG